MYSFALMRVFTHQFTDDSFKKLKNYTPLLSATSTIKHWLPPSGFQPTGKNTLQPFLTALSKRN